MTKQQKKLLNKMFRVLYLKLEPISELKACSLYKWDGVEPIGLCNCFRWYLDNFNIPDKQYTTLYAQARQLLSIFEPQGIDLCLFYWPAGEVEPRLNALALMIAMTE